jgi:hypothetical protein
LIQLQDAQVEALANHIIQKTNAISTASHRTYSELQFDCDWSDKTRTKYFHLLRTVKSLTTEKTNISATIRLHQIKYFLRTGVPPVGKGMLMFYNMGNVTLKEGANSIFNKSDAEKYVSFIHQYPLALDVALPIFQWAVVFQNNKMKQILSKNDIPTLSDTTHFYCKNKNHFIVKFGFFEKGFYFKENDEIKTEQLSFDELNEAAGLLKKNAKNTARTITLFDLDEFNLQYYGTQNLEKIYDTFQ